MNSLSGKTDCQRRAERGYALISVLAATTLMLIAVGAALPSVQHETQRQREEEMFYNGAQVATALAIYYVAVGTYPTKFEDLMKPITIPPGKIQNQQPVIYHLRPSALTDPMTQAPWRVVRFGDPLVREFLQAHDSYAAQQNLRSAEKLIPLLTPPPPYLPYVQTILRGGVQLPGVPGTQPDLLAQLADESAFNSQESRPIVGVVSRSPKKTIRTYYGIGTYDRCLIPAAWYFPGQGGGRVFGFRGFKIPMAEQNIALPLDVVPSQGLVPQAGTLGPGGQNSPVNSPSVNPPSVKPPSQP